MKNKLISKLLALSLITTLSSIYFAPSLIAKAEDLGTSLITQQEEEIIEFDIDINNYEWSTEDELIAILDMEIEKFGEEVHNKTISTYAPAIGTVKKVTARISNSTIMAISSLSWTAKIGRVQNILTSAMGGSVLTFLSLFGKACSSLAAVNAASGYTGFAMDITSKWMVHRAFDTDQWIEYTGWGITNYSTPYRYR